MRPDGFRNDRRFATYAIVLALLTTRPAFAGSLGTAAVIGNAPLIVALGAAAFALLALLALRRLANENRAARQHANEQIGALRAALDEREALLSAAPDLTVLWAEQGPARIYGHAGLLLPPGRQRDALLSFEQWLPTAEAGRLARAVEALRVHGAGFDIGLVGFDGQNWRATGTALGVGSVLRVRPQLPAGEAAPALAGRDEDGRALLAALPEPAFLRDRQGRLSAANAAYLQLAARLGRQGAPGAPADLFDGPARDRHLGALQASAEPQKLVLTAAGARLELVETRLPGGSFGYLRPLAGAAPAASRPPDNSVPVTMVSALTAPAALFDARHELVAFNTAYAQLWKLGDWLRPGLDERLILDRLRRDGRLPSEADYQAWRTRHLAAYDLKQKRVEPWHLPDGRMLTVTAAPVGAGGGVFYLFEDVSREKELLSQNRALLGVQRSTLNALSDAVAVFGTNGRLQLFNPRLSALWRLPVNLLEQNPHIDQMAEAVALQLPEDGADIWRKLKPAVVDLTPTRADFSGRLTRSDGRLIDYAVVRLPDGQKLVTFLDVTESANYSRVLKERNDALVTADRLKDAFVQNVSYELRSPLTNIIGFTDLLASTDVGPLNEKQRAYMDYIRASSVTLGVLIDSILDLATVDAGIAELKPEPQDARALVDKAYAGVAATFPNLGAGNAPRFHFDIAPDLPPLIADGTRLVQVLYNLFSSAARFSEAGGEVRVSVASRGGRVLFAVEDDGEAMSEELRAALTQRPDGDPAGRDRGAGLGFAIVRAFVHLHGGTISVDRPRGTASRVTVSLPLDASAAASTAAE